MSTFAYPVGTQGPLMSLETITDLNQRILTALNAVQDTSPEDDVMGWPKEAESLHALLAPVLPRKYHPLAIYQAASWNPEARNLITTGTGINSFVVDLIGADLATGGRWIDYAETFAGQPALFRSIIERLPRLQGGQDFVFDLDLNRDDHVQVLLQMLSGSSDQESPSLHQALGRLYDHFVRPLLNSESALEAEPGFDVARAKRVVSQLTHVIAFEMDDERRENMFPGNYRLDNYPQYHRFVEACRQWQALYRYFTGLEHPPSGKAAVDWDLLARLMEINESSDDSPFNTEYASNAMEYRSFGRTDAGEDNRAYPVWWDRQKDSWPAFRFVDVEVGRLIPLLSSHDLLDPLLRFFQEITGGYPLKLGNLTILTPENVSLVEAVSAIRVPDDFGAAIDTILASRARRERKSRALCWAIDNPLFMRVQDRGVLERLIVNVEEILGSEEVFQKRNGEAVLGRLILHPLFQQNPGRYGAHLLSELYWLSRGNDQTEFSEAMAHRATKAMEIVREGLRGQTINVAKNLIQERLSQASTTAELVNLIVFLAPTWSDDPKVAGGVAIWVIYSLLEVLTDYIRNKISHEDHGYDRELEEVQAAFEELLAEPIFGLTREKIEMALDLYTLTFLRLRSDLRRGGASPRD